MNKLYMGMGILVTVLAAACGGEDQDGSTGSGGSGASGSATATATGAGGAGGMGGAGGSGGTPNALKDQGTVTNTCGPADGPALNFMVGTPSSCDPVPEDVPYVGFYAYPGSVSELMTGQSWDTDPGTPAPDMTATWYEKGGGAPFVELQEATITVLEVTKAGVRVKYSFATASDGHYSGEATLTVCEKPIMCG